MLSILQCILVILLRVYLKCIIHASQFIGLSTILVMLVDLLYQLTLYIAPFLCIWQPADCIAL